MINRHQCVTLKLQYIHESGGYIEKCTLHHWLACLIDIVSRKSQDFVGLKNLFETIVDHYIFYQRDALRWYKICVFSILDANTDTIYYNIFVMISDSKSSLKNSYCTSLMCCAIWLSLYKMQHRIASLTQICSFSR